MHIIKSSSFILLIVLQFFALNQCHEIPEALLAHAKKLHEMCQKLHSVKIETVEQSVRGDLSEEMNFKCYVHCLLHKVGLIDEQNIVHLDLLKEVFPEEFHHIFDGFAEKCGTKAGKDGCETAFNTVKCYKELQPKLFSEISMVLL